MGFQLVSEVTDVETIAWGKSVRESKRLRRCYGRGRWRKLKGIASIRLSDGTIHEAELHGMKHMTSGKKKSKLREYSAKKRVAAHYVICVRNQDYPASLELRKIYTLVADSNAAKLGLIRVIDESGEDYLYPEDYFMPIKLPRTLQRAVQLAS
jgi:hypothetical protein